MELSKLGHEMRKLRKEKNWSQKDLEEYSNITQKTISKMENGFLDEVGIIKVDYILDLLGMELSLRPKGRPKTLEELQDERK